MAVSNKTIARPYALSVFEIAKKQAQVSSWYLFLQNMLYVIRHQMLDDIISHPHMDNDKREAIICDLYVALYGVELENEQRNFLRMLLDNLRLQILPEITEVFEEYKRNMEGKIVAQVVSYMPLSHDEEFKIKAKLADKFKRQIELDCRVDPSLLGGVVIYVDDLVIDRTVKTQIRRLAQNLQLQ